MESLRVYSLPAKAALEAYPTREGDKLVAEKPVPEVQGCENLPQLESEGILLESEQRLEEIAKKKELAQGFHGPERGLRRLLCRLAETILRKEVVLKEKYHKRANKEVSEPWIEGLRAVVRRLEILLWQVLRVVIRPILRLALMEYRDAFTGLFRKGRDEIGETKQQEHSGEALASIADTENPGFRSSSDESVAGHTE